MFLWNAFIAAAMFLPVFLVALEFELRLRGEPGSTNLIDFLDSAAYTYLLLVVAMVLASLVYSLASLLLPYGFVERYPRLAALAVTPVIPASLLLFAQGAALFLWIYLFSTIVAMIAYGMCARVDRDRQA